jgi:small subunit ribosomal protein S6
MRHYEATVVLDPTLGDDGFAKQMDRIVGNIEKQGGSMLTDDRWGLRNLAYSIKKQDQGYYAVLEWEGPGAAIAELDRLLRLDENVLRHLVVHMDPKELAVREEQRKHRAAGIESRAPDRQEAPGDDYDDDDEADAGDELESMAASPADADVAPPEEEVVTADEADAEEEDAEETDVEETDAGADAGESASAADTGESADTSDEDEAGEEPSESVEEEDDTEKESE